MHLFSEKEGEPGKWKTWRENERIEFRTRMHRIQSPIKLRTPMLFGPPEHYPPRKKLKQNTNEFDSELRLALLDM